MEHRPSILAHNYEHKVFSLINHRLTIQEAHSALTAHIFGEFSHLIAHCQKSELAHLIAHFQKNEFAHLTPHLPLIFRSFSTHLF